MVCETIGDTSNDLSNWNYLKTIQKIPERHTVQARHQGTAENSTANVLREVLT